MKTKYFFTIILLTIFCRGLFSDGYIPVNFECGGYVTEVVANQTGPHTLYARTDVGGVYKSLDNGNDWQFISQFAKTPGALMTQGLAINPNDPNNVLVACGTTWLSNDIGRGIYKTTDGGVSWNHVLTINFGGDDNEKLGGECILFDPSNSHTVYAGGEQTAGSTYNSIYISYDGGSSWKVLNSSSITGNITSIAKRGSSEIWVGTYTGSNGGGVWKSLDNGSTWTTMKTNIDVFRILLSPISDLAYVSDGELEEYRSGGWVSITPVPDPGGNGASVLTALMFVQNGSGVFTENTLLVARQLYANAYITTDYGYSWNANPLTITGYVPKHSYETTNIYSGKSNFTQDPQNSNNWYVSGGAYCFTSIDGGNTFQTSFQGMDMTVMYDVYVGNFDPSQNDSPVFYPLADWTLGVANAGNCFNINGYQRYPGSDFYYTNGTRVFTAKNTKNPNDPIAYMTCGTIGRSERYYRPPTTVPSLSYFGALVKSTDYGWVPPTSNWQIVNNNLPIGYPNHSLIDGLVSDYNNSDIIVLVGGGDNIYQIQYNWDRGVFISTNSGQNFTWASLPNDLVRYENSAVASLWDHEFNLAKDNFNDNYKYLYLEQYLNTTNSGGFFSSSDGGFTWYFKSQVVPKNAYIDKGCLISSVVNSGELYLGIRNQTAGFGLYHSIDYGASWTTLGNFKSVQTLTQSLIYVGSLYVFGQSNSDSYNHLYIVNVLNGNITSEITNNDYPLPSICSLTPENDNHFGANELWIGTQGQGVFFYFQEGPDHTNHLISGNKKIITKTYTNYLGNNYPNPFNPTTKITYSLSRNTSVTIKIYDLLGKEISVLVNEEQQAGIHEVIFNGTNLSSGIYFYLIVTKDFKQVKKMVLVK